MFIFDSRFYTDNPGYWLIHCHISFDLIEGQVFIANFIFTKSPIIIHQVVVLSVGDEDQWNLPPDFPTTCSDHHWHFSLSQIMLFTFTFLAMMTLFTFLQLAVITTDTFHFHFHFQWSRLIWFSFAILQHATITINVCSLFLPWSPMTLFTFWQLAMITNNFSNFTFLQLGTITTNFCSLLLPWWPFSTTIITA